MRTCFLSSTSIAVFVRLWLVAIMLMLNAGVTLAQTNAQRLSVLDPVWYLNKYPDLKAAFGTNIPAAQQHWLNFGIREGRDSAANFSITSYVARYPDLKAAFGNNWALALNHYLTRGGPKEHRNAAPASPTPAPASAPAPAPSRTVSTATPPKPAAPPPNPCDYDKHNAQYLVCAKIQLNDTCHKKLKAEIGDSVRKCNDRNWIKELRSLDSNLDLKIRQVGYAIRSNYANKQFAPNSSYCQSKVAGWNSAMKTCSGFSSVYKRKSCFDDAKEMANREMRCNKALQANLANDKRARDAAAQKFGQQNINIR